MNRVARRAAVLLMTVVVSMLVGVPLAAGADEPSASAPAAGPSALASPQPPLPYAEQPGGTDLAPGSYLLSHIPPLQVVFTVPSGWFKGNVPFAVWESDTNSSVGFQAPDNVFKDACDPAAGTQEPSVGPTVDDLVAALAGMRNIVASAPVDVTLGGYAGKQIDLTADPALSCGELAIWDYAEVTVPGPGEGASDRLWIVDADGTRLVVIARTRAEAPPDVQAELEAVVNSVRITPVPEPAAS
jgi:hypothetical protein